MGKTTTTTSRWECDGCGMVQDFDGTLPHHRDDWRTLRTEVPELPAPPGCVAAIEQRTGQDWLLCRACYRRATAALSALREVPEELRWRWLGKPGEIQDMAAGALVEITGAQLRGLVLEATRLAERAMAAD
jgi:hypothetical protein